MDRAEIERIVEEAAAEARGNKRNWFGKFDREQVRYILNMLFYILGAIGVVLYFTAGHEAGRVVIGAALVLKIVEYFIRFFL